MGLFDFRYNSHKITDIEKVKTPLEAAFKKLLYRKSLIGGD